MKRTPIVAIAILSLGLVVGCVGQEASVDTEDDEATEAQTTDINDSDGDGDGDGDPTDDGEGDDTTRTTANPARCAALGRDCGMDPQNPVIEDITMSPVDNAGCVPSEVSSCGIQPE